MTDELADERANEAQIDAAYDAAQAYWASPEGVERQFREWREKYGTHSWGCDCGDRSKHGALGGPR